MAVKEFHSNIWFTEFRKGKWISNDLKHHDISFLSGFFSPLELICALANVFQPEGVFNVNCWNSNGQKQSEYGILIDAVDETSEKNQSSLSMVKVCEPWVRALIHFLFFCSIDFQGKKKEKTELHLFEIYSFL